MNQIALENFKIDKTNWKKVKLGDVVFEPKETTKNPVKEGIQHVVGLEHIDSGDIHLRRSASIDESTTFTKKFRKGDVLFGRRRAYLKKAALAEFDGICSGDITVMRAKGELVAELLPFIINNDWFFDFAVTHSAGGLSPRVKFQDLAKYEFYLPSVEHQILLAKSLWVIDNLVAQETKLLNSLQTFYRVNIEKLVPKQTADYLFFGDVVTIRKGITYTSDDYATEGNGIPLLNLKSIERGGGFNVDGVKYYDGDYLDKHFVKNDDLIVACTDITRDGNVVGFPLHPSVYQNKKMLFTMDLIAIEVTNNSILRDYLYYVLKSRWVHYFMFARSPGTTVLHLDVTAIGKLKIPNINIDEQKDAIDFLKKIELSIDDCKAKIKNLCVLQKKLINQLF